MIVGYTVKESGAAATSPRASFQTMTKLLVIQHVPHERLGTLEPGFKDAGCEIVPFKANEATRWPLPTEYDGIVSMGGPQSVYQQKQYPYLTSELALLREAAKSHVPILGVCLGAQLLAEALGGKVRPAEQKEIGWYPVMREPGADGDPMMEPFGQTETVFQWHGDTFSLPKGAVRLSSSPLCEEQGFRYGDNIYAFQFHVEMTEPIIRAWMMNAGNRKELAALKGTIDPLAIRRQSPQHIGRLGELSRHVAMTFCDLVKRSTSPSRRSAHARKI